MTDAYMFAVSYPEGTEAKDATDFFICYGSALRRDKETYFSSLAKLFVIQKQEDKKKSFYDAIIKPAKFVSLPKLVFRQSKPAIIGIESLSGTLKQGQQLINKDGHVVGSIASMEDKGETLPDISRGQRVAMALSLIHI